MMANKSDSKFYCDLHLHTKYSDGTSIPKQNVIDCAMKGMEIIAITDHDSTKGYAEAKKEASRWGLKLLTGVEITTPLFHILGYDFDIENERLQELLSYSRECQEHIALQRIDIIRSTGIPITFDKVKLLFPESRLAKYSIIMALLMDSECRKELTTLQSDELMNLYLCKGGIASKVDKGESVSEEDAINAIHDAGGFAVLAHPFKEVKSLEQLEKIISKGINGIEIQPNFENKDWIIKYAQKKGLILTFGSDYHGAWNPKRQLLSRSKNQIDAFWK